MELMIKYIEAQGLLWLCRSDKEHGYFCHVYDQKFLDTAYDEGVSSKAYGKDLSDTMMKAYIRAVYPEAKVVD